MRFPNALRPARERCLSKNLVVMEDALSAYVYLRHRIARRNEENLVLLHNSICLADIS